MIASTKILIIVRLFPFKIKPDIRENIKTNLFLSQVINIDLYIIKSETILIFVRNAFGGRFIPPNVFFVNSMAAFRKFKTSRCRNRMHTKMNTNGE